MGQDANRFINHHLHGGKACLSYALGVIRASPLADCPGPNLFMKPLSELPDETKEKLAAVGQGAQQNGDDSELFLAEQHQAEG